MHILVHTAYCWKCISFQHCFTRITLHSSELHAVNSCKRHILNWIRGSMSLQLNKLFKLPNQCYSNRLSNLANLGSTKEVWPVNVPLRFYQEISVYSASISYPWRIVPCLYIAKAVSRLSPTREFPVDPIIPWKHCQCHRKGCWIWNRLDWCDSADYAS